jgi:DNA-binding Xre family transcriptional regulator
MISYSPLWSYIRGNGIDVLDLCHDAVIGSETLDKLNRDDSVELSVIADICRVLGCDVEDVVTIVHSRY